MTRELGLAAEPPPRRVRTKVGDHPFPCHPTPAADLAATHPNHVRVGDITDVRVRAEFVYLAVLPDVFTRRIRGWQSGQSLDQSLTLTALTRALRRGAPPIHHSDQGMQYAATRYVERLLDRAVAVSTTAVGKPEENGDAERLIRTIREEEIAPAEFEDFADASRQSGRFPDAVHHRKLTDTALGYLTPAEFEQMWRADQPAAPTGQHTALDRTHFWVALHPGLFEGGSQRRAAFLLEARPSTKRVECPEARRP